MKVTISKYELLNENHLFIPRENNKLYITLAVSPFFLAKGYVHASITAKWPRHSSYTCRTTFAGHWREAIRRSHLARRSRTWLSTSVVWSPISSRVQPGGASKIDSTRRSIQQTPRGFPIGDTADESIRIDRNQRIVRRHSTSVSSSVRPSLTGRSISTSSGRSTESMNGVSRMFQGRPREIPASNYPVGWLRIGDVQNSSLRSDTSDMSIHRTIYSRWALMM